MKENTVLPAWKDLGDTFGQRLGMALTLALAAVYVVFIILGWCGVVF